MLSEIATLLTGALRAEDVFARYGGEEFAVICRGSDLTQAQIVAERMRKAVEKHRFVVRGHAHPGHDQRRHRRACPTRPSRTPPSSSARADQALYKSKHGGRNRVTIHQS